MSASSSARGGQRVAAGQVVADPLRLRLGERHRRPQRLQQGDEVQAGQRGMEDAPVEREVVAGRGDQRGVEEREADLVAGAVDDDVRALLAAVLEDHGARRQPREVRLGRDVAVREPREDRVADRGVRLERAVVGLGQAVALHRPDRGAQRRLHEALADRERHPRLGHELVERAAEDVLRDDPGAAPGGQEDALGGLRRLDRDVHRRVAHARARRRACRRRTPGRRRDSGASAAGRPRRRPCLRRSGSCGSQWWPLATSSAR